MKKGMSLFIMGVVLFSAVLTGLGCFWLGTELNSKDDKCESTTDNPSEVIDDANDGIEEVVDMTDEVIDSLGKSLSEGIGSLTDLYGDTELNYNNLNEKRLSATFAYVPDTFSVPVWESEFSFYEKINLENFEHYYKLLFGSDKEVEYASVNLIIEQSWHPCYKEDNYFTCNKYESGMVYGWYDEYIKYDHSEYVDGNMIVYNKFLILVAGNIYNNCTKYSGTCVDGTPIGRIEKDPTNITYNDVWDTYGDQAREYKLTFNLDSNNNWYWVKTEIV